VVVVDHGYGIRTLFGHSSKLFVNAGEKVKRGQKIAEVGSTGKSTGPHLHYEIRKNGQPVNPAAFFSQASF
jgi:murein DD-endopeptidase MepM/ murein hydrolase activator NlpD